MTGVGTEVRRLRESKGWGQTKLAAEAGMAVSGVSQIENGHRNPNSATLIKLASALEVEVSELFPKDLSLRLPLEERGERPADALEQAIARVLEPVRTEALREQQAANRTIASEGIPQVHIGDPPEAEAGKRFVDEFSPDEIPAAFGEVALGYARFERANVNLEANYTRAQELLRERDEKNAQLEAKIARLEQVEEGNVRLREENARLRQDIAELKSEAEREAAR